MMPDTATELTFTPEQLAQLLDVLGLPADTADAELVVTTAADLRAQVDELRKPSAVAAAAKAQGLDVVDSEGLAALRADAEQGRELKAAAAQQKIAASVDDAISRGKITPARREHWVSLIGADPAMADVLAAVPAETAVPLTEVGHSTEGEPADGGWFYD
jgi:ABC-type transporter Mla MlaB component